MEQSKLSHIFIKGESAKRVFDYSANLIGLVNSFFTIRYLSVFNFGVFQLILAFLNLLDGFDWKNMDGPIAVEMRYWFAQKMPQKAKRLFWESTFSRAAIMSVLAIGVFLGSSLIAGYYGQDVGNLIKIVSGLLLLNAVESSLSVFLKSIVSFAHWSFPLWRELTKAVFLTSFFLMNDFNITTVLISHVAGEAGAVMVVGVFIFMKQYKKTFAGITAGTEMMLPAFLKKHGSLIFFRYAISRVTKNLMPWFIKFFINTEAVAFYSVANNLAAFVQSVIPMNGITISLFSKIGLKDQMAYIFNRSVKYTAWLSFGLMAASFVTVPFVIPWLFPQYTSSVTLFVLLMLSLPIYSFYKVLKVILSMLREYRVLTMRLVNEALVIPITSAIFLPLFGILGSGGVYMAIYLERTIFFYSRLRKLHPEFKISTGQMFRFDRHDRDLFVRLWISLKDLLKRKVPAKP
ncbi:MAG: hypothetical protein G01um10143_184 [Parcubacteria group bacterium Gr01-1014_3]|nr:MAG: hypothetical protein G01um10143_184 [Parcubacteria group bacterium Gr01-1014_3]